MVPAAILVAALRARTDITTFVAPEQVGTILHGTYPAIRVTQIGGPGRVTQNTGSPQVQWEVWGTAADADAEWLVAQCAAAIEDAIENGTLSGTYPGAGTLAGTWTVMAAMSSPDPTTWRARYLGTVGMLVQP
jgi:hypothetical protein